MFGLDWSDSTTLWLNLTNLGLGLIVLACLAVVGGAVLVEFYGRYGAALRRRHLQLIPGVDSHTMHTPELGFTMADGGEPQPPQKPKRRSPKK